MAAKDPLPSSISRYKILKRLGEGGMGSLYLARDPEMDRLLAIKLLREDVESDELRERFKREARANARLNHQNIVIVYDVGEDMGRPFIAMEYIEGNTLSGVIRGREDLTLDRKLTLMEQLCDGLAYAHRAGIVHRDIKPANLMLDGRGTLKILDFGIARIGHAAATGMTQAGTLMGTLNYMSPEQMTGRPVDHRTDIFAVGAVVYEFLAFQRAFPGDIQDGVLHRIIHEPPPPLDKFVPGIDKAVVNIVAKALEKDREQRYQDLEQMRQDIAKFRARQLLKDDPTSSRRAAHDAGTIVVRPSAAPPTPGPVLDPKKLELQRKREQQIEKLLDEARSALDSGDAESVFTKCESVLMLDPDNVAAVELSERAQSIGEQQQLKTLLTDARAALSKNDLEKAQQVLGQALVIDPTSAEVLALRKEIDTAKKRRDAEAALQTQLRQTIDRAKKALSQQTYETAIKYADEALAIDAANAEALDIKKKAAVVVDERRRQVEAKAKAKADAEAQAKAAIEAEAERKRQEDARLAKQDDERKRQETERKKQQEEAARLAKEQKEQAARLAKQQEEERKQQEEARKRQDAERKKQQEEAAARAAKARQDDERKQQEETRRQQDEARKREEAERKRQQEETARLAKAQQQADRDAGTVVNLRPAVPVVHDVPAPVVEKKGGLSPVVMGGAAAAVLVVGVVGYFAFGGTKTDTTSKGGAAGAPIAMTFTVTPWAHLEFAGKTDASPKGSCDTSPSCVLSLPPGVYNVRAINEAFRELDFEVTVGASKPGTVSRSFEGYNPESEVQKLLAK